MPRARRRRTCATRCASPAPAPAPPSCAFAAVAERRVGQEQYMTFLGPIGGRYCLLAGRPAWQGPPPPPRMPQDHSSGPE
eukprot:scaffold2295_cov354-Prasinococcus_capsulatus_cf.AAC.14